MQTNSSGIREMVCLSGMYQAGFEERTFRILAKNGDTWFVTDGRNPWTEIKTPQIKSQSQVSSQYRVYLEPQGPGLYANLPMVRNSASVGTFSLFPPADFGPGGLQTGAERREAAVCFDLYDDDQGLPETLEALNRLGIKATFFLNGEFIRQHPQAAADIADAGHEAASMFFAIIDLSNSRYRISADFISRGLARNEDEFFMVTGKELTLLWHPPWYTVSSEITAAAAAVGYVTSDRNIDPLDWVGLEDEKNQGLLMLSPSQMVDNIIKELKPGSIIPVRLGLISGGRNDYLFSRINVLLDAVIRARYTLTTVSALR
jgi:peptidoglycan/xylan/chitin deacetylase (PgdA/CDA1 family)